MLCYSRGSWELFLPIFVPQTMTSGLMEEECMMDTDNYLQPNSITGHPASRTQESCTLDTEDYLQPNIQTGHQEQPNSQGQPNSQEQPNSLGDTQGLATIQEDDNGYLLASGLLGVKKT